MISADSNLLRNYSKSAAHPIVAGLPEMGTWSPGLLLDGDMQLAAVDERLVSDDVHGTPERGSLAVLAGRQLFLLRPSRKLTVGGELQRRELLAR
jgi:hypothetical protein